SKKVKTRNATRKFQASPAATKHTAEKSRKRTGGTIEPLLPGNSRINLLAFVLLALGTVLLYSGDLHLGFFEVDDPGYVTDNPWIRGFTAENIGHILSTPYFANYSPVHLLSYMLDHGFAGLDPYTFHLSSNIWAGIASGLVYLVALAVTRRQVPAMVAATLFAVHPVHVEAVAWISSRKDLVATVFALPSFLAYLKYRQQQSTKWLVVSVLLFAMAVAGKLSVATFPAVFFAWDVFVEKRPLAKSLLDKIPFIAIAFAVALAATSAQPSMGNTPDPWVLTVALGQNIWLLSGFAEYVLYRMPPDSGGIILTIAGTLVLAALIAGPYFIRNKYPKTAVLAYWILFAFIPAQVLSFTHPVTDRYVFFPSVAAMILLGWGLHEMSARLGAYRVHAVAAVTAVLALLWARNTLLYLGEWQDPKSVWYAATGKSSDPAVFQNLGTFYLGKVDRITAAQGGRQQLGDDIRELAGDIWVQDARLGTMTALWSQGQYASAETTEFANVLRDRAWEAFELSLARKENRVMPGLFYNRGLILLHRNDLAGAEKEFHLALDEAARETFAPVREQLTVYCHYDLGLIAWRRQDFPEALKWFRLAEDEQYRFGGNWIPDLSSNRQRLEKIVGAQPAQ
ncbi:MAG TPA: tetratricopeptide repeat protein, partial [Flavisolibacter sp.]